MGLKFRELKLKKSPDCPVCSESPSQTELIDYEEFCGVAASDAATQEPRFAHEDLSPAELKEMLERGDDLVVLDVRTPVEHAIGAIEGSRLIPIQEIMHRLGELDMEADIVAYCHTGVRSRQVLEFLKREGFSKVRHLAGGIDSWSLHVDPLIPRY